MITLREINVYQLLFNLIFTKMDPEKAHHFAFAFIRFAKFFSPCLRKFTTPTKQLEVQALGLTFPSPFGLAAGFDKNAEAIAGLAALGFGHVEVGTLTRHPQEGNLKPRLFRLVSDKALINRMGFNNGGSAAAVARIEQAKLAKHRPIIGANIGKSRNTEVDQATPDYVYSARRLAPVADYIAINVSSPNTPGLRSLQNQNALRPLLEAVKDAVGATPLLVKIAPDMSDEQIDEIVQISVETGLAGIIATNTTTARSGLRTSEEAVRDMGDGGLSGEPLKDRALHILHRIHAVAPEDFCIISVGGVRTAEDVYERLNAGATLVQGYTAFVYEGPMWARKINVGLKKLGFGANR